LAISRESVGAMNAPVQPERWDSLELPTRPQSSRLPRIVLWILVAGGAIVLLLFGFLVALGVGIESGRFPEAEAVPGKKVALSRLGFLRERGLLEESETIIYFYSSGMLSFRAGGCFFTERRVVSYWENLNSHEVEGECAEYPEIVAIEPAYADELWDDTRVDVRTNDGRVLELEVSNSSGRDKVFVHRLQEEWRTRSPSSTGR
jgi:hypothetical protein